MNKSLYLERKPHQPANAGLNASPLSRLNWNLKLLVFGEGEKTGDPGKNPKTSINNKRNPHLTPGPGIEPGPRWSKVSSLTTASSLLSWRQQGSHGLGSFSRGASFFKFVLPNFPYIDLSLRHSIVPISAM